jgi:hypothetical protein
MAEYELSRNVRPRLKRCDLLPVFISGRDHRQLSHGCSSPLPKVSRREEPMIPYILFITLYPSIHNMQSTG